MEESKLHYPLHDVIITLIPTSDNENTKGKL